MYSIVIIILNLSLTYLFITKLTISNINITVEFMIFETQLIRLTFKSIHFYQSLTSTSSEKCSTCYINPLFKYCILLKIFYIGANTL